jgi:tetratricopeptide (TPR) repeat protein
MKRLYLVLVALVLFYAGIDFAYGQDDLANGNRLMELGEYESAIRSFNNIIAKGIDNAGASYIAAMVMREEAYRVSRQYQLAISDCTELIRLMIIYLPEDEELLARNFYHRGFNYQQSRRLDEAIKDFNRAIQIFPSVAAYGYRGRYYGLSYSLTLLKLDEERQTMNPETRNRLIQQKNNYYAQALSDFESAFRIKPNDVWVREGLELLEKFKGEYGDNRTSGLNPCPELIHTQNHVTPYPVKNYEVHR